MAFVGRGLECAVSVLFLPCVNGGDSGEEFGLFVGIFVGDSILSVVYVDSQPHIGFGFDCDDSDDRFNAIDSWDIDSDDFRHDDFGAGACGNGYGRAYCTFGGGLDLERVSGFGVQPFDYGRLSFVGVVFVFVDDGN